MRLTDHIHKLKYFVHVADAGSIKAGSARAYLSQPQMTKIIHQLEDCLGGQLFIRSKSGVKLTSAGALLLERSRAILQEIDETELILRSGSSQIEGEVKIGTYDSIARYFFPDFMRYIKKMNPKIRVHLTTGKSRAIAQMVSSAEIHLGIIVDAKTYGEIEFAKVYQDSFGLYFAPNLKEPFSSHLIFSEFQGLGKLALRGYIKTSSLISCDNLETVKSLAEEGMGLALLPHRVAREGVLSGKLVESNLLDKVKGPLGSHSIDLCYNSKKAKGPAQDFVKSELIRFLEVWSEK